MQEPTDIQGSVTIAGDAGRYLFRADDNDRGGPVGSVWGTEADSADIQNFADHVLHKESRHSSRFASFTTEVKIARKFTAATDIRFIRKVEVDKLKALESQGIIRMWYPDQVFEAMMNGPRGLAKQAGDVRAAMRKNHEILIEGEIPADIFRNMSE